MTPRTAGPQEHLAREAVRLRLTKPADPIQSAPAATIRRGATGAEDPHASADKGAASTQSSASTLYSGPRMRGAPAWTSQPGTVHESPPTPLAPPPLPSSPPSLPPGAHLVLSGDGTLQAALESASGGDELVLADGIYTGSELNIGKNITIRARNAGRAALDGEHSHRLISITAGTIYLDGLAITNGKTIYEVQHAASI